MAPGLGGDARAAGAIEVHVVEVELEGRALVRRQVEALLVGREGDGVDLPLALGQRAQPGPVRADGVEVREAGALAREVDRLVVGHPADASPSTGPRDPGLVAVGGDGRQLTGPRVDDADPAVLEVVARRDDDPLGPGAVPAGEDDAGELAIVLALGDVDVFGPEFEPGELAVGEVEEREPGHVLLVADVAADVERFGVAALGDPGGDHDATRIARRADGLEDRVTFTRFDDQIHDALALRDPDRLELLGLAGLAPGLGLLALRGLDLDVLEELALLIDQELTLRRRLMLALRRARADVRELA